MKRAAITLQVQEMRRSRTMRTSQSSLALSLHAAHGIAGHFSAPSSRRTSSCARPASSTRSNGLPTCPVVHCS
eukprot:369466-Pleurochrysis_carterae.AAC.2